jgi:hypothetical protein
VSEIVVYDDVFVAENVHSGLEVTAGHRQNLHELILGARGVVLARTVEQLAERITQHNTQLRTKANAIPAAARGSLSVDDFCALTNRPDIDQAIQDAERRLTALKNAGAVRTTPAFDRIGLPAIDLNALENLLLRDLTALDATALATIKDHFGGLGEKGEQWVSAAFFTRCSFGTVPKYMSAANSQRDTYTFPS